MTEDDPGEHAAAPNCPACLTPLVVFGDGERARWRCSECGLAIVA